MSKYLIVVESPSKCSTIRQYLGKEYTVVPTYGHITQIYPISKSSVNLEDFSISRKVKADKEVIQKIITYAKQSDMIYLGCDFDREGESIAYDVLEVIKQAQLSKPIKRITFTEITKTAILEAITQAKNIDENLVQAQRARSCIDFIIGMWVSNTLLRKVCRGISAGRVQSPALRMVCEREKQIKEFIPKDSYTISATLDQDQVVLSQYNNSKITPIEDKNTIKKIYTEVQTSIKQQLLLTKSSYRDINTAPKPPFTTATLQQHLFNTLGLSVSKTMSSAQSLYEGININKKRQALITYIRTDSYKLSNHIVQQVSEYITDTYGKQYHKLRVFKAKSKTQESHEAIRPVDIKITPDSVAQYLTKTQYHVYKSIYTRTIASQMIACRSRVHRAEYSTQDKKFIFTISKSALVEPGYQYVYGIQKDQAKIDWPHNITLNQITINTHTTKPKPKMNPGSLIKYLEESGVGRPSTYNYAVDVLLNRSFVSLNKKSFTVNDVGIATNKFLSQYFPYYTSAEFTSVLEQELDDIALGNKKYIDVVKNFWGDFLKNVDSVDQSVPKQYLKLSTICPSCQKNYLCQDISVRGYFIRCLGFPKCKYTRSMQADNTSNEHQNHLIRTDLACEKCKSPLALRKGKYGRFYGCINYPACKFTHPFTLDKKCPVCNTLLIEIKKKDQFFAYCSLCKEVLKKIEE